MTARYFYALVGWVLRAPRPLPYLMPTAATDFDIDIRFEPYRANATPPLRTVGPYRIFSPRHIELQHRQIPTICVRDGCVLTVDTTTPCTDALLHTVLFGPAFAVLCHQRGCPPLHASAAVFDGGAIAVGGDCGAGKSTTIRALMKCGGRLLADDQLVVSAETAIAAPGFASMKLWRSAADWLGDSLVGAARVQPDADKFHLQTGADFYGQPAPVKAIFVLTPDEESPVPTARRLPRVEAIATLDRLVYRRGIADAFGSQATIFNGAIGLSAQVPVYQVRRATDLAQLHSLTGLILDIAASHGLNTGTLQ